MGCIGGADRTFACKSQECLWQDLYILKICISLMEFGYLSSYVTLITPRDSSL